MQHRVLCAVLLLPLADGEIELAVAAEHHAAAEVRRRVAPVLGDEDLLDVLQRFAVEPRACERRRRERALAAFGIRQIQDSVLREIRMRQDLEQPAEHRDAHLGHTRDRLRVESAVAEHAQAPRPLRDQQIAVRQPGEAPRVREPVGDLFHTNLEIGRLVDLRERRQRRRRARVLSLRGLPCQHEYGRKARQDTHRSLPHASQFRPARIATAAASRYPRRMVSKRWTWLAGLAVLFAGLTNAHGHVHYCFDGQEPPAAVHLVDSTDHDHELPGHDDGTEHDDLDLDLPNQALAKAVKHDLPAIVAVAWAMRRRFAARRRARRERRHASRSQPTLRPAPAARPAALNIRVVRGRRTQVPRPVDRARPAPRGRTRVGGCMALSIRRALALACAATLMGFAEPVASQALTLASAIEQTLARNPELRVYAPRLTAGRARAELAALRPPLELQAEVQDAFGTGRASGFDIAETTFALSQVVELGGKRGLRVGRREPRARPLPRPSARRPSSTSWPRSRGDSFTSLRTRSIWRSRCARPRWPRTT